MLIVTDTKMEKEYGRYGDVWDFIYKTDYLDTPAAALEELAEAIESIMDYHGGMMTIGGLRLRDGDYDCIAE